MSVAIIHGSKFFDIKNPELSDVVGIEDIAHSLSLKCRFNGHCSRFYSVAEHSVLCSRLAPKPLKLNALMHDAHEAFLGDITGPIKMMIMNVVKPLEDRIDNYLGGLFDIPTLTDSDKQQIKYIDRAMLLREARLLFDDPFADKRLLWPDCKTIIEAEVDIMCLAPTQAKQLFLDEYKKFGGR